MTGQSRKEVLEKHLSMPGVSASAHIDDKVAELCSQIAGRKKVYLDTCYWVYLREARLERARRPEHSHLLELLSSLVKDGRVICPVSDVAFGELSSQSDDLTRAATANILDELSLGVAVQTEELRAHAELELFLRKPHIDDARDALYRQSWTKACFVFGPYVATSDGIEPSIMLAIQKSAIDELWGRTFSDVAENSSAELQGAQKFDLSAARINASVRQFDHEIPTLEKAFLAEVAGGIDVHRDFVLHVCTAMYSEQGGQVASLSAREHDHLRETMRKALVNSFRHARQKMAKRMPTLYIHSMCHAALRMDRQRKLKGSFLRDIHHGTVGVGYHDAMFTENPLRALMIARNVALDKVFGCSVISDETEALQYLRSL